MVKLKECPPNKILNPLTNRCVNITGKIGKQIISNNNPKIVINDDIKKKPKICPEGKILNPKTNYCVSILNGIGKKIYDEKKLKKVERIQDKYLDRKWLLDTIFKNYPIDHSLDKEAVKKFIAAADPSVQDICKKIIYNTDHISFEKFLTRINKLIKELLSKLDKDIRVIYCFLSYNLFTVKEKSNYWIYLYVINYIKKLTNDNIKVELVEKFDLLPENNANVILIDDCIYSGSQMSLTIEDIYINNKKNINFYLLVPYISNKGLKLIEDAFHRKLSLTINNCKLLTFNNTYYIKSINAYLTPEEIFKIGSFYDKIVNFNNKYMIYFDHKLADPVSTITHFYLGIVPCNNNKSLFLYNTKIISIPEDLIKNFIIIPIIKNCGHYTNHLNKMSPECPSSSYKKESFKKFIEIIKNKDNVKHKSLSLIKKSSNKDIKRKLISY